MAGDAGPVSGVGGDSQGVAGGGGVGGVELRHKLVDAVSLAGVDHLTLVHGNEIGESITIRLRECVMAVRLCV